jgi:hypothetical protein
VPITLRAVLAIAVDFAEPMTLSVPLDSALVFAGTRILALQLSQLAVLGTSSERDVHVDQQRRMQALQCSAKILGEL